MSGTIAKTLFLLSLFLAVGLVLAVPVADAASNTSDSPYTSVNTDAYVLSGFEDVYVANGSAVTVNPYIYGGNHYFSVMDIDTDLGLSLSSYGSDVDTFVLSGTLSGTGTITITITEWVQDEEASTDYTVTLHSVDYTPSSDSESDSGSDALDDYSADNEVEQTSTVDEGYSYWLAVIIIAIVLIAIIYLIKKVM